MLAEDQVLTPGQPITPAISEAEPSRRMLHAIWQREWLVVLIITTWAAFILFWRLDDPPKYIYDEVYHAFTGNLMVQNDPAVYEWWKSAQPNPIEGVQYEWTHPPLGKLIIGGSIWLFGNNSWGWRFSNAVFGLICVALVYGLARALFRDRVLATVAAALSSVEGLMFAESRIGTNDIFQLAFLLAAYLCFVPFLRRPAREGVGWLFATGLFLGLAWGTKWPALYSIVLLGGVALVRAVWPASLTRWFATVGLPRVQPPEDSPPEVELSPAMPVGSGSVYTVEGVARSTSVDTATAPTADQWQHPPAIAAAGQRPARWPIASRLVYLAQAAIAMVAVPVALYIASYIQMFVEPHDIPPEYAQIGPVGLGPISFGPATLPDDSWWSMFVGEQWQMWHYHTTLTAGHPYYSKWWEWLLDIRPVFYYVDRTDDYVANTYNLGNPLLYWAFPIAIVLGCWLLWRKRDARLALVLGAFAINWLPWALSPRGMFFYHFLPSVPFLVLLVAYCLTWLWRQPSPKWRRSAAIYVGVVFVSFAFFYTQLAAWPVPQWYADIHYWLPSWQ